jgi:hypothetical protein
MSRLSPLLITLSALVVTPLVAQQGTLAALSGEVRSAFNGGPLSGVMIAVPGVRRFAVTDSSGTFRLDGLPRGTQKIRIAYEGRETIEHDVRLRPGSTQRISVVLEVEAVDLAPIVVTSGYADWRWGLAGFFERRRMGFGAFYTREEIEQRRPANIQELLAAHGVSWSCRGSRCGPAIIRQNGPCFLATFLNGASTFGELELVAPDDLGGIEVYSGRSYVPFGQQPGMLPRNTRAGCGAVYLWTRAWRSTSKS